jgi:2-methylaconitate cis-trans-isomerase PrpF
MQKRLRTVVMRGGTSRALFFHGNHLPADPRVRDRVILAAYGSPDPNKRQIDGLGGAVSSTSKLAVISRSNNPNYDVVYDFGQVSIDRPIVDKKGNCGNISSAVGPFAVDEGLVPVVEPVTTVRIHQLNTDKLIIAEVPVKNGQYNEQGDFSIPGVPGSGGKITLRFVAPGGSVTGKLLPTGNPVDLIKDVPGVGDIEASLLDAANPGVFVRAGDLGIKGGEIGLFDEPGLNQKLEAIRARAAVMMGFVKTPAQATAECQAVPKLAVVAPPQDYISLGGSKVLADEMDICARIMSMGPLHKSYAVTGAVCLAGAARIEGSLVNQCLRPEALEQVELCLGHPGGVMPIGSKVEKRAQGWHYAEALVFRTARRLMEGYVLVPDHHFKS